MFVAMCGPMVAAVCTLFVGVLLSVVLIARSWPLFVAIRHGRYLADVRCPSPEEGSWPAVTVIVPARDEESMISRCLESLSRQDYPNLEIVAVNDRSTDGTGDKMDAVAASDDRVQVVRVNELPSGWLGKSYANKLGFERAAGDWLLFTDGDVLFREDCIRRAVSHAEVERLDHLALFPELSRAGFWESAASCCFGVLYMAATRPWHARNPLRPDAFAGVGAFNLVRRSAYEAIGTHDRLRMEIVDDLKLAKLIKRAGLSTDILGGRPHVCVRWQVGLRGVVRGLEKNGFAGADFNVGRVIRVASMLAVLALGPIAGALFAPTWWSRLPFVLCMCAEVAGFGLAARSQGHRMTVGLVFPVAGLVMAWALLRSAFLTLRRGGVSWRDTFYSLDELRRGLV